MFNFDLLTFAHVLTGVAILFTVLALWGAAMIGYQALIKDNEDYLVFEEEDKPSMPPYGFEDWHYYDGEQPEVKGNDRSNPMD